MGPKRLGQSRTLRTDARLSEYVIDGGTVPAV